MALQDGLLSFAIKETIFLSSDRAGIGELQELELVPDVEVLENESYISITGCLQLFGKYEPIRDTAGQDSGGAETLVQAMTFAPFRPEGTDGPYYGWEEQIGHRVPLNITIPQERIAEMGDIYAIVDSFDYKLEGPHQLLIEAELKIVGIALSDQSVNASSELPGQYQEQEQMHAQSPYGFDQPATAPREEAWEFAHVAADQEEGPVELSSLEEIEQKLAQLEQQLEQQAEPASYESVGSESGGSGGYEPAGYEDAAYEPESYESAGYESSGYESAGYEGAQSTSLFDTPALEVSAREYEHYEYQAFGEVTEVDSAGGQPASYQDEGNVQDSALWGADTPAIGSAGYDSPIYGTQVTNADQAEQWEDIPVTQEEQDEATLAIHDNQHPAITPVAAEGADAKAKEAEEAEAAPESAEAVETAKAVEVAETEDTAEAPEAPDAVEVAAEPAETQTASEEVEVRIAISGKPSREESGNVNITSIFSQASRAKQEAMAQEAESSSSSSRKGSVTEATGFTLEAMQNLTSFIRNKEERSSQLKMCIIQRDETLEQISQRYSLPVSKIVEVNRLSSEQLVAGQILYIPQ